MKSQNSQTLKFYWDKILNYKVSGFFIVFFVITATILSTIVPLFYKNFFNALNGNQDKEIIVKNLLLILLSIAVFKFFEWVFWRSSNFLATHFQSRIMADLANQCFAYLHKHSFSYFTNNFVGSLVKRVRYFTNAFEAICDQIIWELLPLLVTVAGITVVLLKINLFLALGVIFWVSIFLIISWLFTKYKFKYDIERNIAETYSTGLLADTITNNTNVKLFNGYKREVDNYFKATDRLRTIRRFTWDLNNIFEAIQGFLMIGLEIGIFYLAINLWQKGILTMGDFVLIQAYLINVFMRIWGFGRVFRKIYESLADAEEMTVILNTLHEISDIPNAKDLKVPDGNIEFKNVGFNYSQTRVLLKDFNLNIRANEKIALIGPSGSGKTTLAKLLLRMHDLTDGQILIDGQDITKVTQESLWKNISLVPQDPILFHRTLMENIRYGNPKATDQEVFIAAKIAHCHEFITQTAEGYNTYVGERGMKLSGGERQRVAIARAILRNSPILILDEATSSLDSESESLIQDALSKLMKDKTVIVVAHRLSTIKKMDRIIVINKGNIVEEGTHKKLELKRGGIYRKLWRLQAGGFIK